LAVVGAATTRVTFSKLLLHVVHFNYFTRMSVHYKFKSSLDYDSVNFDGGFISVADLKKAIVEQKRLGHGTDFDLRFTHVQTNEGVAIVILFWFFRETGFFRACTA
jgi:hypothetical protein